VDVPDVIPIYTLSDLARLLDLSVIDVQTALDAGELPEPLTWVDGGPVWRIRRIELWAERQAQTLGPIKARAAAFWIASHPLSE
jgi:hypothetical protein